MLKQLLDGLKQWALRLTAPSRVHSTYIYYIVFTGCLVVCIDCRKLVLASKREPSCKLHEILKTCVKCSTA